MIESPLGTNSSVEMAGNDEFYSFSPLDNKGNRFPFDQLRGKVVLVVNVASQCSFSRQYFMLEQLYEKYRDQGFVIIAVPCNQFGNQEPGTDEQIAEFCKVNFDVKFPLMKKSDVNGADTIPLYNYLKNKKKGILGFSGVKWNFEKFLVGRDGSVINRWASTATPQALEPFILKALQETS